MNKELEMIPQKVIVAEFKVQWLRLALSKRPNWVGVFSPTFTWGRKQIQFPKRRVFFFFEYRTMEKVQKNFVNSGQMVFCTRMSYIIYNIYKDYTVLYPRR
jgi:hypothetical protein